MMFPFYHVVSYRIWCFLWRWEVVARIARRQKGRRGTDKYEKKNRHTLIAFRRISIVLANAVILSLLARVVFFGDNGSDLGAFGIASFIALFIFNLYALMLYKFFWENPRKRWYLEAAYLVLLLLPALLIINVIA